MINNVRFAIIRLLWKLPRIARTYCWANAVAWSVGNSDILFTHADQRCYYCLACHTDKEIEEYQKSWTTTSAEAE